MRLILVPLRRMRACLAAPVGDRLTGRSVEQGLRCQTDRGVGLAVAVIAAAPLQHLEKQPVDGTGEEVEEFAVLGAIVQDALRAQALREGILKAEAGSE